MREARKLLSAPDVRPDAVMPAVRVWNGLLGKVCRFG